MTVHLHASTPVATPPVLAHFALEVCIAAVLLLPPLLQAQPVHILAAGKAQHRAVDDVGCGKLVMSTTQHRADEDTCTGFMHEV
jgi:hypothetical protein